MHPFLKVLVWSQEFHKSMKKKNYAEQQNPPRVYPASKVSHCPTPPNRPPNPGSKRPCSQASPPSLPFPPPSHPSPSLPSLLPSRRPLPIYLPPSTYLPIYLSIYLSIYLPTHLPIYLPASRLLPSPPARPRAGVPTSASHTLPKAFFLPSPRPKPSQIQAGLFSFFFLFHANQAGLEPDTSLFSS